RSRSRMARFAKGDIVLTMDEEEIVSIDAELEMKNEPIDDFSEIKQEEPILDIYCPSTEFSLPIKQTDCHSNDQIHTERMDDTEAEYSYGTQRVTCIVCYRKRTRNEMQHFTKNETRRTRWVKAVRATEEGRRSLMEVLNVTKFPLLCGSHFKPSDFNHKSSQNRLRLSAVPSFKDYCPDASTEEADLYNEFRIPNEINKEAGIMQEDSIADIFLPSNGKEGESVQLVDKSCVCSECGKNLITKSRLEFHMRVHTGAKTFICPHCDAYFLIKSHRNNRIRFVHEIQATRKETSEATKTDKKSYLCTECGLHLHSKQALSKHVLLHTGEKPFPCPHCNASFCDIHDRNYHIRSVHKMQPFACLSCGEQFYYLDEWKQHLVENEGHQAMEEPPLHIQQIESVSSP
ncbi:hypothetical protein PMAYCL1PPCAC_05392, partial [Pristionchus mayeri]